jgi:tetratricopeptide (TPR) repeat protein
MTRASTSRMPPPTPRWATSPPRTDRHDRRAKAAERGAALLVGNARRLDGAVLWRLSRYPEALAACAEAQRLRARRATRIRSASPPSSSATYYAEIDLPRAKETYERALAIFRAIGRQASIAGTLNNIANIEHMRGNYDAAGRAFEEALTIARDLGRKKDGSWRSTIWAVGWPTRRSGGSHRASRTNAGGVSGNRRQERHHHGLGRPRG